LENQRIISFYKHYDGETIVEYLGEHVEEMIKSIDIGSKTVLFGEELLKQVIESLDVTGLDISYYDILYASIVFHDIGKAFYREQVKHAIKKQGTAVFSGHEIVSAIILEELFKTLEYMHPSKYTIKLIKPALFAVLFHHHALSIRKRTGSHILQQITRTNEDNINETITQIIKELGSITKNNSFTNTLLNQLKEMTPKIKMILRDTTRRYNEIREELIRTLMRTRETSLKKLMYLTLTTLITLDYEAARKTRKQEPTTFGKMCSLWKKYYLEQKQLQPQPRS